MKVSQKIELPYDPVIPLLGICEKKKMKTLIHKTLIQKENTNCNIHSNRYGSKLRVHQWMNGYKYVKHTHTVEYCCCC